MDGLLFLLLHVRLVVSDRTAGRRPQYPMVACHMASGSSDGSTGQTAGLGSARCGRGCDDGYEKCFDAHDEGSRRHLR